MAEEPQPRHDHYDVVVIGAGIGGLTAGAMLAKEGMRVLVLDQRPTAGGVCHSFARQGFTFDVGPHLLSGCGPRGVVRRTLAELGVERDVEFLAVNPLAQTVFPQHRLTIPPDFETYVDSLSRSFPKERPHLMMLFREMSEVYEEIDSLPSDFGILDFLKVPVTHPIFMKYPNKTYADMMDEFLRDPKLKSVISGLWVYFGMPPSQISAVFWSVVMMAYFLEGGFYPKGGLGSLTAAMVKGFEAQGGEFVGSALVTRIMVEGDEATGIEFRDVSGKWGASGELVSPGSPTGKKLTVLADRVISNGDARRTLLQLVGESHIPQKYRRKLAGYEVSLSLLKVGLGASIDLAGSPVAYHDTAFFPTYDFDAVYARMQTSLPEAPCDITIPSITDPSLAPQGHHCIYLWNYAPFEGADDWEGESQRSADRLVRWAEDNGLPGLSQASVVREVMTPQTMHGYSLSSEGAPYGWAFPPSQMGFGRLQPRTPIKNLYLTGHWTTPGAGIAGVVMSGRNTASIVAAKGARRLEIWRKSA